MSVVDSGVYGGTGTGSVVECRIYGGLVLGLYSSQGRG